MRKLIIIFLLIAGVYASDTNESISGRWSNINSEKIIYNTKEYIKSIDSEKNRAKAKAYYEKATKKLKELTSNISCSFHSFNVKQALLATYTLKILKQDDTIVYTTAVAISDKGELVSAYIDSFKSITAIDYNAHKFVPKVEKSSDKNDLLHLHIDAEDIEYAKTATKTQLGEEIYLLSYDNLLLKSIVSKNDKNTILVNVQADKAIYGAGIYNSKNELIAILTGGGKIDKTSKAIKISTKKLPAKR